MMSSSSRSSFGPLHIRYKMMVTQLKRRSFFSVACRYKAVIAFAVFVLFAWMQLGSLRNKGDGEFVVPTSAAGDAPALKEPLAAAKPAKVREYPDFDYKYDLRREKKQLPTVDLNEIENMVPPRRVDGEAKEKLLYPPAAGGGGQKPSRDLARKSAVPPVGKPKYVRRRNSINGVEIKSRSIDFDVIGGVDVYKGENLDPGYDEFAADEAKVVPGLGDYGEPVKLSAAEEALAQKVMEKEAFNLVASDKISLNRDVLQ